MSEGVKNLSVAQKFQNIAKQAKGGVDGPRASVMPSR